MPQSDATEAPSTAIAPPTGWTDDEAHMYRDHYWSGTPGDIKDMLGEDYGLRDAQPIWTQKPEYGNLLFIFQATSSTGKISYYVWNGIESSVCFIDAPGIKEIRESINTLGKGKGLLGGLKVDPVLPIEE